MWLFTKHGFYSVVAHRDEPDMVLVRARIKSDLEALVAVARSLDINEPLDIKETPRADYAYRIFMPRRVWNVLAAHLTAAIDYPNFKAAVHGDGVRDNAYMSIWRVMVNLQDSIRDMRPLRGW